MPRSITAPLPVVGDVVIAAMMGCLRLTSMGSRRGVALVSSVAILLISIGWRVWTAHRMIGIGEFASDHAASGYPGAGTWIGFLVSLIIGMASLAVIVVLVNSHTKQH
jgi:hypothetical protein